MTVHVIEVQSTTVVLQIGGARGPQGFQGPAGTGGSGTFVTLTGPVTQTAVAGTTYVCDVTSGDIVINLPALTAGQSVGAIAAAGGTAYATNSITVNADSPQTLAQPAPNNLAAAVASYVIGGTGATSGGGELDAGTSLTWFNGGLASNVLPLQ